MVLSLIFLCTCTPCSPSLQRDYYVLAEKTSRTDESPLVLNKVLLLVGGRWLLIVMVLSLIFFCTCTPCSPSLQCDYYALAGKNSCKDEPPLVLNKVLLLLGGRWHERP